MPNVYLWKCFQVHKATRFNKNDRWSSQFPCKYALSKLWPPRIMHLENKIAHHPSLKGKSYFFPKIISTSLQLERKGTSWSVAMMDFKALFFCSVFLWEQFTRIHFACSSLEDKLCQTLSLFWNLMPLIAVRSILSFLPSQNNTFFLNLPWYSSPYHTHPRLWIQSHLIAHLWYLLSIS